MSNQMSTFVQNIKPNEILSFNQKISGIPNLIKLTLGEPDFNTPDHIKQAGIKAIKDNESHYTNPRGILPLRQAISKFLKDKYGLHYNPKSQIVVTSGVTESIRAVFSAILNPGDEVIIPTPIFSIYTPNVICDGGKPVIVNVSNDNYLLTPQRLEATLKAHPKTKALVLNFPNNPVGNTYTKAQLEALANVIKKHHIFCICDEIYSELTYNQPHTSMGTLLPDQAIVMNGVSKTFAMTGWRVGFVCGPTNVITGVNNLHVLDVTSVTTCAQYAALEAFKNGYDDGPKMRKVYKKRRDILRAGLSKAGFTSPEPSGAFYIFAKIPSQFTQDSFKFAYQLAKEAHVGTIPGNAFGPGGDGHIRISYAASTDNIKEAVRRIQKFVKTHKD
ncbi:aminotransferase class I/II-fold pyridoxal phosphate-dependent enzyme [uncultured bacterium]|nr:aminotransferase class I/II-fold pyridoxal phosphate-dependent enzyme [uncultured bacterium]